MSSSRIAAAYEHNRRIQIHNLRCAQKHALAEVSGSLGDLGTLLPLMIALTLRGSISLPATLLFTGVSNVLTGLAFGLPLPVQPMKAIAAVALAKHFTMSEMAASGLIMGAVVSLLSVLGLLKWAQRLVPTPVVRGIQMGAGLSLCMSSTGGILLGALGPISPSWSDNFVLAGVAAFLLLCSTPFPRFPYALVVFLVGLVLAVIRISSGNNDPHQDLPSDALRFGLVVPSGEDYIRGTFSAALGQLPLTILNSIIAVVSLAGILQPSRPTPSPTAIGCSVGVMNLIAPWFGGMPACHGSGGLAAQYRFGARSGSSVIILGAVKVVLGVVSFFHGPAITLVLGEFPKSILGVMVLAAGVELARAGANLDDPSSMGENEVDTDDAVRESSTSEKSDRWMVLLVTAAGLLAFKNDFVGFVAGMCWHWGLRLSRSYEKRRSAGANVWDAWRGRRDVGRRGEDVSLLD